MNTLGNGMILGRLLEAALLSALVGLEREIFRKAAGVRTHILVGMGSALAMIVSLQIGDPGRIAAQVITGIGFLGAGAIIHAQGGLVLGLTTAATIWVTAMVGLASGAGLHGAALVSTGLTLLTLLIVGKAEKDFEKRRKGDRSR